MCVCVVNAQVLNKHVNTWATKSTKPFTCMEASRAYMFVGVSERICATDSVHEVCVEVGTVAK